MKNAAQTRNESYLKTAVLAAQRAGALLLKSYGKLKENQIHSKAKNDFVTELDKRSEELVISTIRKKFPAHSFYAEESGHTKAGQAVWIIDPLDGTSNYIHQIPLFAVSIAVHEEGRLQAGVILDPLHQEYFTARQSQGAYLNKKKMWVSRTAKLQDSLIATGIPFRARNRFEEYIESLKQISLSSGGMRRGGSAAIDLAYVASGRFDGFWEIDLAPWDIAAGALLIQEAGGKMTDVWGDSDFMKNCDVLGSNPWIYQEILQITADIFKPVKGQNKWPST